jgi:hypothetical protein
VRMFSLNSFGHLDFSSGNKRDHLPV